MKEEKRKQLNDQILSNNTILAKFQEKNTLTKLFSYVAHFLELGFQLKLEFQASLDSTAWRAMQAWNSFQKCAV